MEVAITKARARLSELVTAAQRGERLVITKYGKPVAKLVRCTPPQRKGGFDFKKWEETWRRMGIKDAPPEEAAAMRAAIDDSALSRPVLNLEDDQGS